MGNKTKIDWADASWNPVTGCLHGCEYCYARGIARRFSCEGQTLDAPAELQRVWLEDGGADLRQKGCHVLRYPVRLLDSGRICPYPFAFAPTLHRYKLDELQHWKKPRTIFVCSMADLFGEWVPDEWIIEVLEACCKAPQHRYLFLTKNPNRYTQAALKDILVADDNFWYGTSTPKVDDPAFWSRPSPASKGRYYHTFISVEPMLERFGKGGKRGSVALTDWVIVGAETGNRKGRVVPEKDWVMELAEECNKYKKPIFMKESLKEIMGDDFIQEFPWET